MVCHLQRQEVVLQLARGTESRAHSRGVVRESQAPAWGMQEGNEQGLTVPRHAMYVQYGRYLCSARAGNMEVAAPHSADAGWSVPWLNLLSPAAARSVKKIDALLQKAVAKSTETEHTRRQRLLQLCSGNTESVVYNNITRDLYDRGDLVTRGKLLYWVLYCIFELSSVMQAIQFTYTVLATHSIEDFACSVGQVSLYIHALDDVIKELGENIPVCCRSTDSFDSCIKTLLAKHAV